LPPDRSKNRPGKYLRRVLEELPKVAKYLNKVLFELKRVEKYPNKVLFEPKRVDKYLNKVLFELKKGFGIAKKISACFFVYFQLLCVFLSRHKSMSVYAKKKWGDPYEKYSKCAHSFKI
jgi:hypothetical protein